MATMQPTALLWLHSLDEAKRQARDLDRPIFVDFFSPT